MNIHSRAGTCANEDGDRVAVLRRHAEQLAPPLAAEFAGPFDRFGDVKLVLLGEATHGTAEFYRARAAITRRLIEKHGFSIVAVLRYLDGVDPAAAARARERYGCLTPWQQEPAEYGAAAIAGEVNCEPEAVEQLRELLQKRLEYEAHDGEDFFDAAQNARIVRAAEEYYRTMYRGSVASWNLRDRHMFETLQRVMEARGPDAKAVVWAHNSHIGNAAATAMGWQGEFNIGELARARFRDKAIAIGFGTDHG